MSVSREQKTDIKDKDCLVEALKQLGFQPTVQEEAPIRGHESEMSKEKCAIVLKKEDHKTKDGKQRQADIGFSKQADGTYSVVTDTWINRDINLEEFVVTVKKEYVKKYSRKLARKAGLVYKGEKTVNGKTRMVFQTA